MAKYLLHDREFSSKSKIRELVQEILQRHQRGDRVSGSDFGYIAALAQYHPDYDQKFPNGIDEIKVGSGDPEHPFSDLPGNECFWAKANGDSAWMDFSYGKALTAIPVPKKIDGEWKTR